jgi:trans-aconitate methyltransferase
MNHFEKEAYDIKYSQSTVYKQHYKDVVYYPIWKYVMSKLNKRDKVLDLGCGPGHLGHMLKDNRFKSYTGIDFSNVAIDMAKSLPVDMDLICSDLMKIDYSNYNSHVLTSCETFEHLESDLQLIKMLPKSKIVFSVPDFMSKNHYRIYTDENFIYKYYEDLIKIKSIKKFPVGHGHIYVVEGLIM